MYTPEEKLKRFKKAEARKQGWGETYRDALAYAAPQRETFSPTGRGKAKDGAGKVFDSTAQIALAKFASNLQSSLVPPGKKWLNLVAGRAVAGTDRPHFNRALEEVRDVMFAHIHMSNFDTQMAEAFLDLAVGTGALLVLPGSVNQPLRFVSVPLSQLYLEEGAAGEVGAVYRRHKLPVRLIAETWEEAVLSPTLAEILAKNPDEEVELVESTLPTRLTRYNPVRDAEEEVEGYLYSVTYEKDKADLVTRAQASNPWVIFRWGTLPGEIYGRGPLLSALPDIKTLNKTKELILKNASLAVAGAYTVADDGVVNIANVKIRPGAIIPVASNAGGVNGPTIAPLPRSGDFNIGQMIVGDLQRAINDALFADPLGPLDLPTKSATEVAVRQQELAKRIGSAFGRLQFELIGPLVRRVLHVLEEQGIVDLSFFRVDGRDIAIEHVSPLSAAQDQEELMAVVRYVEFVVENFGAEHPVLLARAPQIAEKVGRLMGAPASVLLTEAEITELAETLATELPEAREEK